MHYWFNRQDEININIIHIMSLIIIPQIKNMQIIMALSFLCIYQASIMHAITNYLAWLCITDETLWFYKLFILETGSSLTVFTAIANIFYDKWSLMILLLLERLVFQVCKIVFIFIYLKALQCRALMVHWYPVPVAKIIRTWVHIGKYRYKKID